MVRYVDGQREKVGSVPSRLSESPDILHRDRQTATPSLLSEANHSRCAAPLTSMHKVGPISMASVKRNREYLCGYTREVLALTSISEHRAFDGYPSVVSMGYRTFKKVIAQISIDGVLADLLILQGLVHACSNTTISLPLLMSPLCNQTILSIALDHQQQ